LKLDICFAVANVQYTKIAPGRYN